MEPQQVELVQSSFEKVAPIADQAAAIFYDELFERAPSLRGLFPDDLTEQRAKLMKMLGTAVNGLTDWDSVRPDVARLGARHVGYGARAEHYPVVGAALLATLAKGLGDDFTPEVEDAWTAAFAAISAEMLASAPATSSPG